MAKCSECNNDLPINGQYAQCRGGCKQCYHFDCTTISQQTYATRSKADKEQWRCHNCRKDKKKQPSSPHEKNENESADVLREIREMVAQMQMDIKNNYENQKKENVELRNKIEELIKINKEKDAKICELNIKVNELEQYTRRDTIEIYGVKEQENENLQDIVFNISDKIGVEMKAEDIQVVHRNGRKIKEHVKRTIIVKLNRKKAEEIINKRKMLKQIQDENGRIFVNEAMSPFYKDLLWKTKSRARELGYQFVWFKRGKLFVRKSEGTRPVRILIEDDIAKYIN